MAAAEEKAAAPPADVKTPLVDGAEEPSSRSCNFQWLLWGNDFVLLPKCTMGCNICSIICLVSASLVHRYCEYSELRPAITAEEDPWVGWCLQWTATVSLVGLFFEGGLAMCIKLLRLDDLYEDDPVFKRRRLLNRKMICVFVMMVVLYHLMAFDRQIVHVGWLAQYYGGKQAVYSVRYMEWVSCSAIFLSCHGQLKNTADGKSHNALLPSSLLTGIYCMTAWQALVVTNIWVAWYLILLSFACYFFASAEQLAYAKHVYNEGRCGPFQAGLLVFVVVVMGAYGIAYLLPIAGWITPGCEQQFYCIGDASFKIGTSIMLMASNDLATNAEMIWRAENMADSLQRLIDTASVPIFSVGTSGKISEWNTTIANLTGVPSEVALHVPVESLLPELRQADGRSVLQLALTGEKTESVEIALDPNCVKEFASHASTMTKAQLVLSAAPRRNRYGVVDGVTFIGYDLTEILASRREADERKRRFLAVVTHELRSPLHGVLGLVQSLIEGEDAESKLRFLRMVKSCASRLLDLVTDIMEMASLSSRQAGKNAIGQHFAKDPVDLRSVIDEVVVLVKKAIDKKNKSLLMPEVELVNKVGKVPMIAGDAHKCTQVFYNLITNACKFTAKGNITVSSEVDSTGEWLVIRVADTGLGIKASALGRIFQPFEQEQNTVIRNCEGLGLGLPIANEVVKRHGGEITVTSEVNVGSTFAVRMPVGKGLPMPADSEASKPAVAPIETSRTVQRLEAVKADKAQDGAEPLSPRPNPKATTPRVRSGRRRPLLLSVDDVAVNHEVVRGALGRICDVDSVDSGREAIDYLQNCDGHYPDAMLLDYMMPHMSGMEVARAVRKELCISSSVLPIIMLSAAHPEHTAKEALKNGCDRFVSKPCDGKIITKILKELLGPESCFSAPKGQVADAQSETVDANKREAAYRPSSDAPTMKVVKESATGAPMVEQSKCQGSLMSMVDPSKSQGSLLPVKSQDSLMKIQSQDSLMRIVDSCKSQDSLMPIKTQESLMPIESEFGGDVQHCPRSTWNNDESRDRTLGYLLKELEARDKCLAAVLKRLEEQRTDGMMDKIRIGVLDREVELLRNLAKSSGHRVTNYMFLASGTSESSEVRMPSFFNIHESSAAVGA
eukprot:TRINITY_DN9431_c1_g4_i1.p1 TRINITY_DN9431_c1_g4~~TRINITY_DN9431_c1_g4_i1.p1  ORF type:complete len:1126 (-),score=218.30 TRINITY_DN9431_c1_g4_i1:254-3631(-)